MAVQRNRSHGTDDSARDNKKEVKRGHSRIKHPFQRVELLVRDATLEAFDESEINMQEARAQV